MKRSFPRRITWYSEEVQNFRERYYNAEDLDQAELNTSPALITTLFLIGVMLRRICWVMLITGAALVAVMLVK